jgi:hypothetical protein
MKALAITLLAGAAVLSAMAAPASALPNSNLMGAATDVAPKQDVRAARHRTWDQGGWYGYRGGANCYGYGPNSPLLSVEGN